MPALALAAALIAGACRPAGQLETRTFALEALEPSEAAALIDPYVYGQREGAEGMVSRSDHAITVRELPENLDRIEAVLARFDVARPAIRLDFMIIEADGFAGSDPSIADVETELRELFNFDGYRLAAKTSVQAVEMGDVETFLGDQGYRIDATVFEVDASDEGGSLTMRIGMDGLFSTTVSIPLGETVVLGSGEIPERVREEMAGVRAAILVVTPRIVSQAQR